MGGQEAVRGARRAGRGDAKRDWEKRPHPPSLSAPFPSRLLKGSSRDAHLSVPKNHLLCTTKKSEARELMPRSVSSMSSLHRVHAFPGVLYAINRQLLSMKS